MANFSAVLDACVLYPAPLRDLLLRLATGGLFDARWTDQIHEEWTRNVLKDRPDLRAEQLQRTRELMDANVAGSLITGYQSLIEGIVLPDPDDRHVLAAAIRAGAGVIVTKNLKDFPEAVLKPFGIEAQHPDDFVAHLIDLDAVRVVGAVRRHRAALKRPPVSADDFLNILERQEMTQTVSWLRGRMSEF